VDCGVSDPEAVALANGLGLPVIVTDHHLPPPGLPPAGAILNPHLGGGFEGAPLAGVGVAFMLAWALRRALAQRGELPGGAPPLSDSLPLVAMGTVADMSPLRGPNRILVRHGLALLSRSEAPWPSALKRVAGIAPGAPVTARDVGFRLAPRLNSAGRMGSPLPALALLESDDPAEAARIALSLDRLNRERFQGQARLTQEALGALERKGRGGPTVVLWGDSWPKGLLGLAASRVAELSRRPTVLFSVEGGVAVGSGRSAPGFDLLKALGHARGLCLSLGGHSEAAGLKVREGDLAAFEEAFGLGAAKQPPPPDEDVLEVDLEAGFPDLEALSRTLPELEPFGQGHPAPVAVVRDARVLDAVPARTNGDKHMVLRVADGLLQLSLVGFGLAPRLPQVTPLMDLALSYDPGVSHHRLPGWRLEDFKEAGSFAREGGLAPAGAAGDALRLAR
jgi:single-stranded-DNA-specific exonuclease